MQSEERAPSSALTHLIHNIVVRCNQSLDAPITTKDNTFLLGLMSFSIIFLSFSFKFRVRIGEEDFPEGVGCRKKRARDETAGAALKELKKKRGPLPKKVREGLNHRKSEKPEALERGKAL